MKCLIVDDEEMARSLLLNLCNKVEAIHEVESCSSALEALKMIEAQSYDLLFLDIEMPDMSGMELLRNFRNLPPVILTTSKTEFAFESYEYNVIDYLKKPIDLGRLIKAVNKLEKANNNHVKIEHEQAQPLYIRSEGKHVHLELEEILYLETMDDYLIFYLENGEKHIVHSTLKAMEEKLPPQNFLKVHRSYLINLNKVDSIEDTHLAINKKVIPISRANRPILMDRIKTL